MLLSSLKSNDAINYIFDNHCIFVLKNMLVPVSNTFDYRRIRLRS